MTKKELKKYTGCPQWVLVDDPHRHTYTSYMPRSVERKQLNECIEAVPETVDYLYNKFTPTTTNYVRGSRPMIEAVVDAVCAKCKTPREKAKALVRWRRANYQHVGKCGLGSEEEILLGGYSMCHDASRTMIVLAQVAGLGARMIIGLDNKAKSGHTLTEVYVGDQWAIMDPSPCIPFPYYEMPDGSMLNAWDIRQHPEKMKKCKPDYQSALIERLPGLFSNYRLANYTIEESTANMHRRFLRLVMAAKIVENYDYMGHMNHKPPSAYADLDKVFTDWLKGALEKRG